MIRLLYCCLVNRLFREHLIVGTLAFYTRYIKLDPSPIHSNLLSNRTLVVKASVNHS